MQLRVMVTAGETAAVAAAVHAAGAAAGRPADHHVGLVTRDLTRGPQSRLHLDPQVPDRDQGVSPAAQLVVSLVAPTPPGNLPLPNLDLDLQYRQLLNLLKPQLLFDSLYTLNAM